MPLADFWHRLPKLWAPRRVFKSSPSAAWPWMANEWAWPLRHRCDSVGVPRVEQGPELTTLRNTPCATVADCFQDLDPPTSRLALNDVARSCMQREGEGP